MTFKPIDEEKLTKAIQLHMGGMSKSEACIQAGIGSPDTLLKYMRRLGLKSPSITPNKSFLDRVASSILPAQPTIRNEQPAAIELPNKPPFKVLIMDTELLPNRGYFYERYSEYSIPDPFIAKTKALCAIGYKWLGDDTVTVLASENPYDDKLICQQFALVVEQADYMVGHNIKGFDIKVLNGRMLDNGLNPLPPVHLIDTLLLARKTWGQYLNGNSLDHLAKVLGFGEKIKIDAGLWVRCAEGDKQAMQEMIEYNKQDVNLLEKIFVKILPHTKHTINANLHIDSPATHCKACGSDHIEHKGFDYTSASIRHRYKCVSCGHWSTFPVKKGKA